MDKQIPVNTREGVQLDLVVASIQQLRDEVELAVEQTDNPSYVVIAEQLRQLNAQLAAWERQLRRSLVQEA